MMAENDWEAGGLTQVCCGVQIEGFPNFGLFTFSALLFLCTRQAVREPDNENRVVAGYLSGCV